MRIMKAILCSFVQFWMFTGYCISSCPRVNYKVYPNSSMLQNPTKCTLYHSTESLAMCVPSCSERLTCYNVQPNGENCLLCLDSSTNVTTTDLTLYNESRPNGRIFEKLDVAPCWSSPCMYGGTCNEGPGDYQFTCTCPAGMTGPQCEINIDDCISNGCGCLGCKDGLNTYTCVAPGGCEVSTCSISQTCVDVVGGGCHKCTSNSNTGHCTAAIGSLLTAQGSLDRAPGTGVIHPTPAPDHGKVTGFSFNGAAGTTVQFMIYNKTGPTSNLFKLVHFWKFPSATTNGVNYFDVSQDNVMISAGTYYGQVSAQSGAVRFVGCTGAHFGLTSYQSYVVGNSYSVGFLDRVYGMIMHMDLPSC